MILRPGSGLSVHVTLSDGDEQVCFLPADPARPRVDRVVQHRFTRQLSAVVGTPTAGADLMNLFGTGALPAGTVHQGDVLIRPGARYVVVADISIIHTPAMDHAIAELTHEIEESPES